MVWSLVCNPTAELEAHKNGALILKVPNGANEEAKWRMPKETSYKGDVKRAEVLKEHIQQDGKKFPRTAISK